jgi:hypothetical protein
VHAALSYLRRVRVGTVEAEGGTAYGDAVVAWVRRDEGLQEVYAALSY